MTLTFEFKPDENRRGIVTTLTVKSTLAPTVPSGTTLFVTGDDTYGEMQVVEMSKQITGQMSMDGGEQAPPARLKII